MDKTVRDLIEEDKKRNLREKNTDLHGNIRENNGKQSWYCKKCDELIVADINGDRAAIGALGGTQVFIKFYEMAALCKNKKCGTFNDLMQDWLLEAVEEDPDGKKWWGRLFDEIWKKMPERKVSREKAEEKLKDYMLGLKKVD